MNIYSFIKLSHLPALGLEEKYVFIIVLVLGIILSYTVIQPIIKWLVSLKFTRLLSYIVSSLLLFNFVCLIIVWKPNLTESILTAVRIVFQLLALFGGGLAIYYMVRRLIGRI